MHEASRLSLLQRYKYIFRDAAGTLALRVVAASLTLILSGVIARILGVADYGTYTYALTWVYFLATPACLGIDRLLVRLTAVYQAHNQWGKVRGILRWSNQLVLATSLLLCLIALSICLLFSTSNGLRDTFLFSLPVLPFFALTTLKQSALQGMQQVLQGQLPESVFRHLFMLGLLALVYFASGKHLGAPVAAGLTAVASGAAFLTAAKLLRNNLPPSFKASALEYQKADWTRHALPLLLVATLGIISTQTETLILGAIKGMEAVSYFTVASRGAELISLALLIVGVPLAPTYARLWVSKDRDELERVARLGAYASLLVAIPALLALIFYGAWFLALFGTEFKSAQPVLEILSVGHIINVMMGSVGLLLIMCGHEREAAAGTAISIIIKLLLCALLIPSWGAVGAAVARSGSLIAWNLLLLYMVHKKLAINPTVFGRLRLAEGNRS
jgi:O-antigen/teichoic acid export membrane protein